MSSILEALAIDEGMNARLRRACEAMDRHQQARSHQPGMKEIESVLIELLREHKKLIDSVHKLLDRIDHLDREVKSLKGGNEKSRIQGAC